MDCKSCGNHVEPKWAHCPFCGKKQALFKEQLTDEAVDNIFKPMFNKKESESEHVHDSDEKHEHKHDDQGEHKPFAFKWGDQGSYGSGVRAQVFEVIVRQAIAGAPWREICAGPMQVNKIDAEDVLAEVERRKKLMGASGSKKSKSDKKSKDQAAPDNPPVPPKAEPFFQNAFSPPRPPAVDPKSVTPSHKLRLLHTHLKEFLDNVLPDKRQKVYSDTLLEELEGSIDAVLRMEAQMRNMQNDINSSNSFEREVDRTSRVINPDSHNDPHRIDW